MNISNKVMSGLFVQTCKIGLVVDFEFHIHHKTIRLKMVAVALDSMFWIILCFTQTFPVPVLNMGNGSQDGNLPPSHSESPPTSPPQSSSRASGYDISKEETEQYVHILQVGQLPEIFSNP
jgi:hypothetical protein